MNNNAKDELNETGLEWPGNDHGVSIHSIYQFKCNLNDRERYPTNAQARKSEYGEHFIYVKSQVTLYAKFLSLIDAKDIETFAISKPNAKMEEFLTHFHQAWRMRHASGNKRRENRPSSPVKQKNRL